MPTSSLSAAIWGSSSPHENRLGLRAFFVQCCSMFTALGADGVERATS
jgi:hypothetical protein